MMLRSLAQLCVCALVFSLGAITSLAIEPSWTLPPVTAPRVQSLTFTSKAAKATVSYHLYTPEIYDIETERRFPVLYWLHGSGGGAAGIGPLSAMFDRAIRDGKIPPMLVVFPNGMQSSMWCDSKDGAVPMETVVVSELVPEIDSKFRTVAEREGRIIEGFSMGGYGAARLGIKYAAIFGSISILAGGPLDVDFQGPRATADPANRERILNDVYGGSLELFKAESPWVLAGQHLQALRNNKTHIRIAVGTRDFTDSLNREFSDHLKQLGIAHTFTELPEIGHSTMPLLNALGEKNWEFYRVALGVPIPAVQE
jgi:enterochelin esterase-like enzyme